MVVPGGLLLFVDFFVACWILGIFVVLTATDYVYGFLLVNVEAVVAPALAEICCCLLVLFGFLLKAVVLALSVIYLSRAIFVAPWGGSLVKEGSFACFFLLYWLS